MTLCPIAIVAWLRQMPRVQGVPAQDDHRRPAVGRRESGRAEGSRRREKAEVIAAPPNATAARRSNFRHGPGGLPRRVGRDC